MSILSHIKAWPLAYYPNPKPQSKGDGRQWVILGKTGWSKQPRSLSIRWWAEYFGEPGQSPLRLPNDLVSDITQQDLWVLSGTEQRVFHHVFGEKELIAEPFPMRLKGIFEDLKYGSKLLAYPWIPFPGVMVAGDPLLLSCCGVVIHLQDHWIEWLFRAVIDLPPHEFAPNLRLAKTP